VVVAVIALWMLRSTGPAGVAEEGAAPSARVISSGTSSTFTAAAKDDRKMTVVLPFANLGPAEDAYFAAGVSEEITSRLAAVSGLGVISRTTANEYDRAGKTIRQIGEDLGVDYVLEGTVRWAKRADGTGRVRITPQLIRVADDTHMWSETYDREIDDIFEVQTEIATQVIGALDVTLLGSERELVADAPTRNMEAYNLYLQAKNLKIMDPYQYDVDEVSLLERATELDPRFVDAWALLSRHHSVFYHNLVDRTDERLSRARRALQRAEEVDPDHYQTHLARGTYYYYGFRDYDRALEEYLAATRMVPNDADARQMVAYIYRRQARWNECIENLEAAFELDPKDEGIAEGLAGTYQGMREFEKALHYYERARQIHPGRWMAGVDEAVLIVKWNGDLDAALEYLKDEPENAPFVFYVGRAWVHIWRREFDRALEELNRIDASTPIIRVVKRFMMGGVEALRAGPEAAREALETAQKEIDALLESSPGNPVLRQFRAVVLALLGEHDAAVREAKLAVDLTAKDKYEGPESLENLALVYAHVGREEEAIDLLERLLETVYSGALTPYDLAVSPVWDPLRDHPRFQKLLPKQNI
jgi:TolB-like protein/tetratricopeptide (TPR) repeat protein